jgi:hypothetical protein
MITKQGLPQAAELKAKKAIIEAPDETKSNVPLLFYCREANRCLIFRLENVTFVFSKNV